MVGLRRTPALTPGRPRPTANALVGLLVPPGPRGTVYRSTSSAMLLGNPIGALSGGTVAAAFGLRWAFLVTAVLLANWL